MSKRVTVSQFYQQPPPISLLEVPKLQLASFQDNIFLAATPHTILAYSLDQKKLLHKIQLPKEGQVQNITIFNNIICFYFQGSNHLWVFSQGTFKQIEAHLSPITAVHQHNHKLYTASEDLTIRAWIHQDKSIVPFSPFHALFGHTSPISCLTSVDSLLLSGSLDKNVIVWSDSTPRTKKQFDDAIDHMLWCQDSDQLAIGLHSGSVLILSVRALREQNKLVVSRQVEGLSSLPLVSWSQINDSFVMMASGTTLQVGEINLGQVVGEVDLSVLGRIVAVKTIKALTLVGVEGKGLFLLRF